MLSTKTGSPKAGGGGGGNKEQAGKHCSDMEEVSEVDTDDDEEVLETAQNGRWQKINVQVSRGNCLLLINVKHCSVIMDSYRIFRSRSRGY